VVKKPMAKNGVLEGSWDPEGDDFPKYCHDMPLLPSYKFTVREWTLKRFHRWYLEAL
jgi:hypothetical protein